MKTTQPQTPKGYRALKKGEVIRTDDVFFNSDNMKIDNYHCPPDYAIICVGQSYDPSFHFKHFRKIP